MRERTIETRNGRGDVRSGGQVLVKDAQYQLRMFQSMIPDGMGGEIPGLPNATGRLLNLSIIQSFLLSSKGDLELVLEDGRRWPCNLTDTTTGVLGQRSNIINPGGE